MNLSDLLKLLAGKKTYLTSIVTCVIVFGVWQDWWHVPTEAYAVLLAIAVAFLRSGVNSSATPAGEATPVPIRTVTPLAMAIAAAGLVGCAPLQPGADPLVVRTEQTLTVAKSSFDLVLHVDEAHRDFWRVQAPAFHSFCEDLRTPVTLGTNNLPRCSAMLWSVDQVKLRYKEGRASFDDLETVLVTLQGTVDQAQAWLTIVTNTPGIQN